MLNQKNVPFIEETAVIVRNKRKYEHKLPHITHNFAIFVLLLKLKSTDVINHIHTPLCS
jgi:hypothetical protein